MRQAINPQTGEQLKGYFVCKDGSLFRSFTNNNGKSKYLTPTGSGRYLFYRISIKGKAFNFLVHRVVACSFIGFSKLQVNHKDGDTKNNNLSNLEFVSAKYNTHHAMYDLKKAKRFKIGLEKFERAILLRKMGMTYREIAKAVGVKSHTSIMFALKKPTHRILLEYAERNGPENKATIKAKKTT